MRPEPHTDRDFMQRFTLPAQWAVHQLQQVKVSAQGIMFSKKSGNNLGLYPVEG
jgi:hypothetical protein